ncbi:MAG: hypothetical protein WD002_07210 [Pseudomonadales bacterium]
MSLFKGNERAEVSRWIVDLEMLLDEMNRESAVDKDIAESESALHWLRKLLAAQG